MRGRPRRARHLIARRRRSAALAALLALLVLAPASYGSPRTDRTDGSQDARGGDLSLREPADFATGALPPSRPFNRIAGDQATLLAPKATLSDSVAVGDFNSDGKPDVAQTNVNAGSVSLFLGDGRGSFAPPRALPVGAHPSFVVVGKLDRDDHLDLAVADFSSGHVVIFSGDGRGAFQPAASFPVPFPRSVAIGRFDGDDLPDLAVASSQPGAFHPVTGAVIHPPTGRVAVLKGSESGTFTALQSLTYTYSGSHIPINANSVAVDDFDGDGFQDLAVAVGFSRSAGARHRSDPQPTGDDVLIYLNRGQTAASLAAPPFGVTPDQPPIRVGASPDAMTVSDLNGDGHPDLAVADNASGDIASLLGDAEGHFVLRARNVTVGSLPRSVAAGDLDNDGFQDLVTGNWHSSTVSVLEGNGDGTFRPAVEFWSGDATTSAGLGDFNGDGRVDVVAGRLRNDELALLLNDSPQPGDGVVITRDIPYGSPTHPGYDPWAEDHTLDVYSPPPRTASFAGPGRPYPVLLTFHGGAFISGDKSMVGYVLRSLALEGIVAVSANYRLGAGATVEEQTADAAHAFRRVQAVVASKAFGGDPRNIFVFGHSAGSALGGRLGADPRWTAEQQKMRAMVLVSFCNPDLVRPAGTQRPSLLVTGDEGLDAAKCDRDSTTFTEVSRVLGANSDHQTIAGRDHFSVFSNIALPRDPARVFMLNFMKKHLNVTRRDGAPSAASSTGQEPSTARPPAPAQAERRLPASGASAALSAGGVALVAAAMFLVAATLRHR